MGSFSISSWKIQKDCALHATNWITRKWKLDSPDSAGSNRQSNPPWSSWIECRDRSRAGQECKQDFTGVSRRNLVARVAPYLHERRGKQKSAQNATTQQKQNVATLVRLGKVLGNFRTRRRRLKFYSPFLSLFVEFSKRTKESTKESLSVAIVDELYTFDFGGNTRKESGL